jgi:hypothetical protein
MLPLEKRADRLAQVQAQVDYHGNRLAVYRRAHGSRPCIRLTELEAAYMAARTRLAGVAADATPEPGERSA